MCAVAMATAMWLVLSQRWGESCHLTRSHVRPPTEGQASCHALLPKVATFKGFFLLS